MKATWTLAACVLLAGCFSDASQWGSSQVPSDRPVLTVPDREKEFADLPVPRDFMRLNQSWARERGTFRMARLVYEGALDPYSTVEFMRKQMELSGWKLNDRVLEDDRKVLSFTKGQDRCRVVVTRADRKTRLAVDMEPQSFGGGAAE